MRLPSAQDLGQLGQLTEARELAALAEFTRLAVRKREIEERIMCLRSPVPAVEDPVQAANMTRWQSWRGEEIRRLVLRLSLITAEMAQVAQLCGRRIAENAVMERLVHKAKIAEAEAVEKKNVMQRTMDLAVLPKSHLLADDLGDENV